MSGDTKLEVRDGRNGGAQKIVSSWLLFLLKGDSVDTLAYEIGGVFACLCKISAPSVNDTSCYTRFKCEWSSLLQFSVLVCQCRVH